MAEYSRMAKGNYVVTGGALGVSAPNVKIVNLPFKPDYVELINYTQAAAPAQHGIPFAFWDASVPPLSFSSVNYDTLVEVFNATPVLTTDMVKVGGGISVFSGGLSQQFGAAQQIVSIAKSTSPTIVTLSAGHGFAVGDTIIMRGLFQSATTGMPQINGIPFTITAVGATTVNINWDSSGSNYTALSGSPASAFIYKVLYPFLYAPQDNVISAITLANTTTIQTTMYHNLFAGQEIAFRIPNAWGTTQLNSLPNVLIPGSPVYGYVVSITDNWTFVVNINSSAYTAYTNNISVANVVGLTFPQVVPVGDVNTGGEPYNGGLLYPPPMFPSSTNRISTINGPAIRGAFVNNTSQGFIIGNAASRTDASSWVGGSSGDVIEYRAYLHDISSP
jgi:hypothetical protein